MQNFVSFYILLIAMTYAVTDVYPDPTPGSTPIQDAIDIAPSGETIMVHDGTYTENLLIEKDLILQSENGADATIIDGSSETHGADMASTIIVRPESNTTHHPLVVIEGFTVTGGKGSMCVNSTLFGPPIQQKVGGGLYAYVSSPRVINNKFLFNGGPNIKKGGALFFAPSSEDCDWSTRDDYIDADDLTPAEGELDLSNNTFFGNNANMGSSVYINGFINTTTDLSESDFDVYSNEFEGAPEFWIKSFGSELDVSNSSGMDNAITGDVYVSLSGNDDLNNGLSWGSAFLTIGHAISMLYADSLNQGTIWLDSGIYSSQTNGEIFPLYIPAYISLIGTGSETTILDGENQTRLLELKGSWNAEINSLSITNGYSENYGGGIYHSKLGNNLEIDDVFYPPVTIQNVNVNNCTAWYQGGGLYVSYNIILDNVRVENNAVSISNEWWVGGAGIFYIYCINTPWYVEVINNYSSKQGGGIMFWWASMMSDYDYKDMKGSIISGNEAGLSGGGIAIDQVSYYTNLSNIIIENNRAPFGAGIYHSSGSLSINKATFWRNTKSGNGGVGSGDGTAIYVDASSHLLNVKNSIIWSYHANQLSYELIYSNNPMDNITYSNIQGGFEGEGNIDEDPLFISPYSGQDDTDYSLQPMSLCIDAGTADLDGDGIEDIIDYYGTAPDMGALEFICPSGIDFDDDGLCDDFDDCVGAFDECLTCNGPGPIHECGCTNDITISHYGQIASASDYTILVRSDGSAEGIGECYSGQCDIPDDINIIDIGTNASRSLALLSDSTMVSWGSNHPYDFNGMDELSDIIAIAAGGSHSLALRADGTVVGWGSNTWGQIEMIEELSNVEQIFASNANSLFLLSDGTVVVRGYFNTDAPNYDNIVTLAHGTYHAIALLSDGTVIGWGTNDWGQLDIPSDLDDVTNIAAGTTHNIALKSDGTVVGWGYNSYGQIDIPSDLDDVVYISAGGNQSFAIQSDGTVVGWGSNYYSQTEIPEDFNTEPYLETLCHLTKYHVSLSGIDDSVCGLEEFPCSSIQSAIDQAADGDTILVSPGNYLENINYNGKNITIGSLFMITQDTSYISETIIDGSLGEDSVVKFINQEDSTSSLIGFTIMGGGDPLYGSGGGIYINHASPILRNLTIRDNYVGYKGGGLYVAQSSAKIFDSIIRRNTASQGAGIYLFNCLGLNNNRVDILNSVISNNISIENMYLDEENAGLFSWSADFILINSTISNNGDDEDILGNIHLYYLSKALILNSILWNKTSKEISFSDEGGTNLVVVSSSDIKGGLDNINYNVGNETLTPNELIWLEGNIDADPLFNDSENGDYLLNHFSPCVDTGTESYIWDNSMCENPYFCSFFGDGEIILELEAEEFIGDAPDMGAFEYEGTFLSGDINIDGLLNVLDIVMLVDLVLNANYDVVGDVNEDGQLNVLDVVILVNLVLNGMPEADSDGDGVIDEMDSDPNNPYQCSDLDGDTCDDCSTGTFNPSDDGYDYDGDGTCDDGDCDDDNDGCQECWDYCP